MPVAIRLNRPIKAIDRNLSEIVLRDPNGGDLAAVGYPMRFTRKGATEIDAEAMTAMIARLAGVPRSAVEGMALSDWNECMKAVMDFFPAGATPKTSSIDTSNADDSGATSATS